jgi:hypothetical protein
MKTLNAVENVKSAGQTASLTSLASHQQLPRSRRSLVIVLGLTLALGGLAATLRPANVEGDQDEEAAIAQVTTRVLENSHYTGHRLDDAMASRFLDRYLEMLDGTHLYFLNPIWPSSRRCAAGRPDPRKGDTVRRNRFLTVPGTARTAGGIRQNC